MPTSIIIIGGIVALALVVVAIVGISAVSEKEKDAQTSALVENANKWRDMVRMYGRLPPQNVDIMLADGEIGYLQVQTVLCEPRSVRTSTHTGGAVRVAKGVTIGRAYSTSNVYDEWRQLCSGTLIVTNKRIIFDGDMHDRTVNLKDVLSVKNSLTQVALSTSTRQKTMLFTPLNGYIVGETIRLACEGGA